MICTVTFLVNGEPIDLALETEQGSALTDDDIIKVLLLNPEKRLELSDKIHNLLYKNIKIDKVTLKDLTDRKGLLGNCGIEYLRTEFPDITFPEGVEANVLLVDNLRIGSKSVYGRVINSNGDEVFVIRGSREGEDVQKLADFLLFRLQVEDHAELFDEDSIWTKKLNEIFKARNRKKNKVSDLRDLLLDFTYNKSNYESMYITNEDGSKESAYNILLTVTNIVRLYYVRKDYDDPFIDTINKLVSYLNNGKKTLKLEFLYNAVKQIYPDILSKLEIKSKTEFHRFFSQPSSNIESKLQEVFDEVLDGEGYKTLFFNLFKVDPEFLLFFTHSTEKGVVFKSIPKTLLTRYGIDYDTITSFDIIGEERGYKIYRFWEGSKEEGKQRFIPVREYLTEDSNTKIYDTEDEAKLYAIDSTDKLDIKKNSFIDFKYAIKSVNEGKVTYVSTLDSFKILSLLNLIPKSIIESIDVPIVRDTKFYFGEDALLTLDGQNSSSFKEIIKNWNISDKAKLDIYEAINTPEKIAIFIYKVNELLSLDRENEEVMYDIIKMIKEAPKKAYYIESKQWNKSKNKFEYNIIPTDAIVIDNYRKGNKQTPVISLMLSILQALSKFNVNLNLMTSSLIKEEFGDTVDPNTDRAFVRNGQIYVNTTIAKSSDLLHEYSHLILGVLKTDSDLRSNYEQLMFMVANTKEGKLLMRKLNTIYNEVDEETGEIVKKISDMDLMEEVFVKMFSNYVMSEVNTDLLLVFKSSDKFLKDTTKIIFNNEIDDLRTFYGKGIESIFRRFSSDVAYLLNLDGLDFSSTKTSRQYSNWISEQIREGNIIEDCRG